MRKAFANKTLLLLFYLLVVLASFGATDFTAWAQSAGQIIATAGDISPASSNGPQFKTADIVAQINPSTVLALGDNQYPDGTLATFNQYYHPSWGRFKAKTRPVPGNHEYHTSGASGYFDYFNGVGVNSGPAGERGKGYYSYNLGSWHLIALNSEIDTAANSLQTQWLTSDIAANRNTCILAYWHTPRFSSSSNHGNNTKTAPFWNVLYTNKADLILTGHDHIYERFAPQTPSAQADSNGITEFVVGTGGGGLYGIGAAQPNSQIRIAVHGVLKLTLNATSYDWQFIDINGQTRDSGTKNCTTTGPTPTGTAATNTTTPTKQPTPTPVKIGDINRDGKVDILDFQLLSNSFGKSQGQVGFNQNADFNTDSNINILDFQILSNNFGK